MAEPAVWYEPPAVKRLRLRVLELETKLRQLAGRHCPGCAGSCPGLEP